jgi:Toastrack DUF4097
MSPSCLKLLAIGTVAILGAGCEIPAQSIGVDASFDRTLHVDGPVDLDVLSRSGHIQIRTGPADTVHVVGHVRAYGSLFWLNGYTASEQASTLESSPPIEQAANNIKVGHIRDEALASNVTISYELEVPIDTRLHASSRSGDQSIAAIRGPVAASSRSGRIHIEHVRDNLDVDTRSGEIEVLDHTSDVRVQSRSGRIKLEGQPSRRWAVASQSGDVDVRLPGNGGAELDVQTRSGSIESDRPLRITTAGSRKRIQGTVGGGGGRLEISTRSGSIQIH